MTLYRDVLKQAWHVTWRYKMLWVFGFLASFWGIGSAYEIIYKSFSLQDQSSFFLFDLWHDVADQGITWGQFWHGLIASPVIALALLLMIVAAILLVFLFYWLFTCSQVALIKGIDEAENGNQNFHNLFNQSKPYFWPIFWVNLGGKAVTYLLLLLLSYPVLSLLLEKNFSVPLFILYLIIFIIVFILVIVIAIIVIYAAIYISLHQASAAQALKRSWLLFRNNWIVSLETALLLFLVSVIVGFAFIAVATISFAPFILLFQVVLRFSNMLAFFLVVLLAFLFVVLIFVLAAAVLTTFQMSSWVTVFERLEKGKAPSKIQRIIGTK